MIVAVMAQECADTTALIDNVPSVPKLRDEGNASVQHARSVQITESMCPACKRFQISPNRQGDLIEMFNERGHCSVAFLYGIISG